MEKSQSKLGEKRAASSKCDVVVDTLIKDHLWKWVLEHSDDDEDDDDRVDDIDGDEKTTNTSTDLLTKPDDIEVTVAAAVIRSSTQMASTCDTHKKGRYDDVLAEK